MLHNTITESQKNVMSLMSAGQHVIIRCPVYRNGRKFEGVIKEVIKDKYQANVIVNGNKKGTILSISWITPIN